MTDRLIRALGYKLWQLGFFGTLRFLATRIAGRLSSSSPSQILLPQKRNVAKSYGMFCDTDIALTDDGLDPAGWMNWILPPFSIGSGGHLNIFRMVAMLEGEGVRIRLHFLGDTGCADPAEVSDLINEHFVPLKAEVVLGVQTMRPAEFVVATSWDTAYWAAKAPAAGHRLYFVQDFEPYFYPVGSEYAFAERTYHFGLTGITAGDWLAEKLSREYGMKTFPFGFSYDKDLYSPKPRRPGPRRVFFYARHVTPRRGFELGLLALSELHLRLPDVEMVFAGWDASEFDVPFPHLNAGVVALDELPELYSQCDVALVLSFTNLSLLPLEVMACGCPVVSNQGPNVEWLLKDEQNALLCAPTPAAIADALERILVDSTLRDRIVAGGLAFARQTDWPREGRRVAKVLNELRVTS
ncbi:glycosyltransferase family 4 protein [Aromatoleum buckelii]|uniref:Glycosyltransferase n=1 Tax=Aromatoleum buckelii TaxID=200254 RepID=A0ABX1N491_9RHOO|nr:glycosyltransferase family 4 protein [Aromatoleum buckelii]MCK0511888.1 glycosyltransferase family 4 protein [Aromatoleum buckelii]